MDLQRAEVRVGVGGQSGVLLAWFAALGMGLAMMAGYAYTPGAMRDAKAAWPREATFSPAGDRPTVVVGLHPRCTCSVATVRELDRILAGVVVRPQVEVLLYRPAGAAEGWERTAFDEDLRRLPAVTVRADVEGKGARAFGMLTSGDIAVFTPEKRLLFRGGLTAARGHEGESKGGRQLRMALSMGHGAWGPFPVFGCPMGRADRN